MKIILSIKPEYVEKILNGTKKFEFRKVAFQDAAVKTVVIYATMPVGKVVGEFEISKIIIESKANVWHITKEFAGIRKQFFDQYFEGRTTAVAIEIGKVNKYPVPINLCDLGKGIKAPQSFRYLRTESPSSTQQDLAFS